MLRHFIAKGGWVAFVCLAVGSGFGAFALQQSGRAAALADHGVVAVATVEGMRTETHRRRSSGGHYTTETDHIVDYAFRAGGRLVEVRRTVPEFAYDELSTGEEVEVRYLPENPERVDVFVGESRRDSWLLLLMAGVFGGTGLVMVPLPWRAARRARRIEILGVEADGVVERARLWNGRWRVWVRFRDAGGVPREGDSFVDKGSAWMEARVGSAVRLRYDPANPSNVAPA